MDKIKNNQIGFEIEEYKKYIKQREINSWIKAILNELDLNDKYCSLYFCSDEKMGELNNNFRGKDGTTDVLSFPEDSSTSLDKFFLGDIVISIPQAMAQKNDFEGDFNREIKFLILHSILHLIGYDHENDNGEQEQKENYIFKKLLGGFDHYHIKR